jgi:hypothetical protein
LYDNINKDEQPYVCASCDAIRSKNTFEFGPVFFNLNYLLLEEAKVNFSGIGMKKKQSNMPLFQQTARDHPNFGRKKCGKYFLSHFFLVSSMNFPRHCLLVQQASSMLADETYSLIGS